MWPRLICADGRRDSFRREALSSFNVAAPDLRGWQFVLFAAGADIFASMWPRLIWRGWFFLMFIHDKPLRCFNVAAPDLARMATDNATEHTRPGKLQCGRARSCADGGE